MTVSFHFEMYEKTGTATNKCAIFSKAAAKPEVAENWRRPWKGRSVCCKEFPLYRGFFSYI